MSGTSSIISSWLSPHSNTSRSGHLAIRSGTKERHRLWKPLKILGAAFVHSSIVVDPVPATEQAPLAPVLVVEPKHGRDQEQRHEQLQRGVIEALIMNEGSSWSSRFSY
ncbi:hypothetical protein SUGI_0037270 [Cryptomeria japonica]|nr:hypothetical protein SUGI_0037270 [Cryptomeria japonica]